MKGSAMKWITRERVKVDRVACPWLIRKFIDPQAEFLFVPRDKVLEKEFIVYDALYAYCRQKVQEEKL